MSRRPRAASDLLAGGNVVLGYADPAYAAPLRRLADGLGAPDTPELRAVGQSVVVRRDASAARRACVARAEGHVLTVASPSDPRLQDFVERWLGQGSAG